MDSTNQLIIAELSKNARTPFLRIARKAGVSESTIRKRIAGMEEQGIIRKYSLALDHSKLGFHNHVFMGVDALPERYGIAVDTLLSESYVDGLIVVQTLQTMTDSRADAEAVVRAHAKYPHKPVVCVFMGGLYSARGVEVLRRNNIPDYNDPLKAVKVMRVLCGVV